jgi:hypothetical protein
MKRCNRVCLRRKKLKWSRCESMRPKHRESRERNTNQWLIVTELSYYVWTANLTHVSFCFACRTTCGRGATLVPGISRDGIRIWLIKANPREKMKNVLTWIQNDAYEIEYGDVEPFNSYHLWLIERNMKWYGYDAGYLSISRGRAWAIAEKNRTRSKRDRN